MAFPATLTNAVDGVTEIVAAHLNNLEAKVGIDNSAVATSLDYLLKNSASINPGHKHSKLWASDGDPEAVTVDAAGVATFASIPVGPGSNPTTENQLARKAYVDLMLPLSGGSMAGNISLNNYKITGLAAASGTGEALRYDEWIAAQDPGHKHSKLWAADGSPEAVTVDAAGNVGIGTSNPAVKLEISDSATTTVIYQRNAAAASVDNKLRLVQLANSDSVSRSTLEINSSFNNITDASRNSLVLFKVANNGNFVTALTINGGNVGIGVTDFGASASKALGLGSGTAPSTSPADMVQMYAADIAAGHCAPHFRTELGAVVKLYQQAHLADAKTNYTTGDLDTEAEIITAFNTTNGKINSLLTYLENLGLIAAS